MILHLLGPTLTKQGYFPAKHLQAADQLLVIHWGTTIGYMNDYVQTERTLPHTPAFRQVDPNNLNLTANFAESSDGENAADALYASGHAAYEAARVARAMTTSTAVGLLGYSKQLNEEDRRLLPTEIGRSLQSSLSQDRYFIIVQAYDFTSLRKEERRKLLWSVHMSMQAAGMNFKLAVPRMGDVASDLYGQASDSIAMIRATPHQRSSVEIGPIAILGESAKPADP